MPAKVSKAKQALSGTLMLDCRGFTNTCKGGGGVTSGVWSGALTPSLQGLLLIHPGSTLQKAVGLPPLAFEILEILAGGDRAGALHRRASQVGV